MDDRAKLVLLKGDHDAMRLCVTWPEASRYIDRDDDELDRQWSMISGVDVEEVAMIKPKLFRNGMLLPDGTVDDEVLGFIRDQVKDRSGDRERS